jgi:hypothetical protein
VGSRVLPVRRADNLTAICGGGIDVRYPPTLIILHVDLWYTTLFTAQVFHWYWLINDHCTKPIVFLQLPLVQLHSSSVTAPSCNVRADRTEIAVNELNQRVNSLSGSHKSFGHGILGRRGQVPLFRADSLIVLFAIQLRVRSARKDGASSYRLDCVKLWRYRQCWIHLNSVAVAIHASAHGVNKLENIRIAQKIVARPVHYCL